jgi:hypothetical protein
MAVVVVMGVLASGARGQFCFPNVQSTAGGGVQAVSIMNSSRVAIGHGGRVRLIDVSNPANPVSGGSVDLGELVRDMDTGAHTCVLGASSLYVIDDNSLASPALLGGVFIGTATEAPLAVDVSGQIAYVATRRGLAVYDLTVPQVPSRIAMLESGALGAFNDVFVTGNRAYVISHENVNNTSFILELDISTPSSPAITRSNFSATDRFTAVTASGNFVYVSSKLGFRVFEISGSLLPERDVLLRSSDNSFEHMRLAVDVGGRVHESAGGEGLRVYNVSNPANVSLAWTVAGDGFVHDIAVDSSLRRGYMADAEGGLRVLDTSANGSPQLGRFVTNPGIANAAAAFEGGFLVAVAAGDAGLVIMNMQVPGNPTVLAALDLGPGMPAKDLVVDGSMAYVAAGSRVVMVSLQSPNNPQIRATFGSTNEEHRYETIGVRGTTVYVPDRVDGKLHVLTSVGGNSLTETGSVNMGGGGMPHDILVEQNGRAHVILHSRMAIFDLVSMAPVLRSSVAMNGPRAIALNGFFAYVAGHPTMEVWNVGNPTAPTRVAVLDGPAQGRGVVFDFGRVTLLCEAGPAALLMVDVSQPSKPLILHQATAGVDSQELLAAQTRMFIADGLGGLRMHNSFTWHPPVARTKAEDVSAGRGCRVEFRTQIQAIPAASYRWFHNGSELVDGTTASGSIISGATTQVLVITKLTAADAGSYTLGATNACGFASVSTSQLTYCGADFDCTGFVDTDDFTSFVNAFTAGADAADFDGTGFVDTDDFTAFVLAFEGGC